MKRLFAGLLAVIIFTLSGIHYYWALGGDWGLMAALPADPEGTLLLMPSAFDCALFATFLLLIGLFYVLRGSTRWVKFPRWFFVNLAGWAIPIVFMLRAMGDFQYVGFFKQVRGTEFAYWDTVLFTPLCVVIGLLGIAVQVLKPIADK